MAFVLDMEGAKRKQAEGVWMTYGDAEFLIASASNLRFQRALSRLQMPHRRKIDAGTMDPGDSRKIMSKALAEGILLDWQGVQVKEGDKLVDVPYSREMAEQMLASLDDLREFVVETSTNTQNFRSDVVAELGN